MRREKRQKAQENNIKNILYLVGSILGIGLIAFVMAFVLSGNASKESKLSKIDTNKITELVPNNEENILNIEEASTQIGKNIEESKNEANNIIDNNSTNNNKMNDTDNINKAKSSTTSAKKSEEQKQEIKDPEFIFPVDGEIIKGFGRENLVYSNTLNEWITHNGVDIRAEKTSVVKAAADGKVKSIKNDPRYGLTVVIDHVNGFTTVYSNLLTTEFVVINEEVKKGQTIGTVGNTATFEILDESHLHFEILKDNEWVDPNVYLK